MAFALAAVVALTLTGPDGPHATPPLVCAECGTTSPPDATDWRAYLTDDGEAAVFCPKCATREFGGE